MIPNKKESIGGNEVKDKKSSGAKLQKTNENATTTIVGDNSAQQMQHQSQSTQQQVDKAKDLKGDVPVVSAAATSPNDDAHHNNNVN